MTTLRIFPDAHALSRAAAQTVVSAAQQAVRQRGIFRLALSGGSTPRGLYRALSESPWREALPWAHTHLFWGDERCRPPDHPESNYRLVHETLLASLALSTEQIHPIPCQGNNPQQAAAAYQRELEAHFGGPPAFDLALLGLGQDGHTASLFPGSPALTVHDRWAVAVHAPQLPTPWRVSLTLPALNRARQALFLVSGAGKAEIVRAVLQGPPGRFPAQAVRPRETLLWYLDAAAAARLDSSAEAKVGV